MDRLFNWIFKLNTTNQNNTDTDLARSVKRITGLTPKNIKLYWLSTQHRSIAQRNDHGVKESNERLEYLGDAVLGAVVAEYLFKKFPLKDEGFLTDIRSRIVNRDALNQAARKIGVSDIAEFHTHKKNRLTYKSIYGDALEALIGAVYLDKGYRRCRSFILYKLIIPHFDLEEIIKNNPNYKSKIIEWAHQENKEIEFRITEIKGRANHKEFTADLLLDNEIVAKGNGFSKKKAEQDAAQKSCDLLEI